MSVYDYDYDSVWGKAERNWKPIDFRRSRLCTALLVFSWIGMVASFVFGVFAMIPRSSDLASILLVAFMLVWIACGIAYIRIRKTMRIRVME